jgi:hypothetical protein
MIFHVLRAVRRSESVYLTMPWLGLKSDRRAARSPARPRR